jgi:hypothetical protein
MFRRFMPLMLSLAAAPMAIVVSSQSVIIRDEIDAMLESIELEKRNLPFGSKEPRYRRSRGAQARPKKRRNRVTVGRRVRRKHRRAA